MKIKAVLIVFFCLLNIPANAETIEEKILMRIFAGLPAGEAYNKICNGSEPKAKYDFKKKENVYWHGNTQMIVARIGNIMHIKNPDMAVEDGVKNLIDVSKKIKQNAITLIEEKGCDSPEAKQASSAYKLYSQIHPAQIFGMTDKEIIKQGGTVTELKK